MRRPGEAVRIEPLSATTWPALEALFRQGGDPRWCWCEYQVGDEGRGPRRMAQPVVAWCLTKETAELVREAVGRRERPGVHLPPYPSGSKLTGTWPALSPGLVDPRRSKGLSG